MYCIILIGLNQGLRKISIFEALWLNTVSLTMLELRAPRLSVDPLVKEVSVVVLGVAARQLHECVGPAAVGAHQVTHGHRMYRHFFIGKVKNISAHAVDVSLSLCPSPCQTCLVLFTSAEICYLLHFQKQQRAKKEPKSRTGGACCAACGDLVQVY
jgi:hypothetical protein